MPTFSFDFYRHKARDIVKRSLRVARNLRRVSLMPQETPRGRVLISYILDPFLVNWESLPASDPAHWHSNGWECRQMARTFLDLGYAVDAISCWNRAFLPAVEYSAFIDVRFNMERLAPVLNQDCIKIMHIDSAHVLFANAAEAARLLAVQQRRGVTLSAKRFESPNYNIENADCATILGNEFTMSTYRYAGKPLFPLHNSAGYEQPWPEDKDFHASRKTFLWIGSGGMVHKGLDLALEAFAGMPDYNLIVCGPLRSEASGGTWGALGNREEDFERAFQKELFETPNIKTMGWVDTRSRQFREIANQCLGLIFPTCSEGQSGSVVTCLHAGLIPIVTPECGVDVEDFGWILNGVSVEQIREQVRAVSELNPSELRDRAKKAWDHARTYHTRANFAREYRIAVESILALRRKEPVPISPVPQIPRNFAARFQTAMRTSSEHAHN
jgi:glycosyltransferase involved in cell wall biosynthesis